MSFFDVIAPEILLLMIEKLDKCSRRSFRETCRTTRVLINAYWPLPDRVTQRSIWKNRQYGHNFLSWLLKYYESDRTGSDYFMCIDFAVGQVGSVALIENLIRKMIATGCQENVSNVLFGMLHAKRIKEESQVRLEMNLDKILLGLYDRTVERCVSYSDVKFKMSEVLAFMRWAVDESSDDDLIQSLVDKYGNNFPALFGQTFLVLPELLQKTFNWLHRNRRKFLGTFAHRLVKSHSISHSERKHILDNFCQRSKFRLSTLIMNRDINLLVLLRGRESLLVGDDLLWPPKNKTEAVILSPLLQSIIEQPCSSCMDTDCPFGGCDVRESYPLKIPRLGRRNKVSAVEMLKFLEENGYDVRTHLPKAIADIYQRGTEVDVRDLIQVGQFIGRLPSSVEFLNVALEDYSSMKTLLKNLDMSHLRLEPVIRALYNRILFLNDDEPLIIYDLLQRQKIPLPETGVFTLNLHNNHAGRSICTEQVRFLADVATNTSAAPIIVSYPTAPVISALLNLWKRSNGKYIIKIVFDTTTGDCGTILALLREQGYPSSLVEHS